MTGFDAVVVGAGPAGSVAAAALARGGATVLLLDRRVTIGEPVRCGELIRRESLAPFLPPEGPWIVQVFDEYHVVSPDGFPLRFHQKDLGVLLDRRVFDKELARRAADAGAELRTSTQVTGVIRSEEGVAGVVAEGPDGEVRRISARLVIAADGVASRVARLAGVDTSLGLGALAATVSGIVEHRSPGEGRCELHFGQLAPGGYAWVFPRQEGIANVGLGVSTRLSRRHSAFDRLAAFLSRRFPGGRLTGMVAGGVPITMPMRRFCWPGLFLAGDAARQANPLTGAGIYTAMAGGALAGAAGLRWLAGGSLEEAREIYEGGWKAKLAPFFEKTLAGRRQLDRLPDEDLNAAARRLGPSRPHRSVGHSILELAATAEALYRDRTRVSALAATA